MKEIKDCKIKLTAKEEIFIREYCQNGFNATQAAIKAKYSKKTARQLASRLLSDVNIKQAIKKYIDSILSRYKDTLEYEIIQTYKLLAFYNPDDVITHEGALKKQNLKSYGELAKVIKGIQTTYNAKGKKQIKVLLQDRDCALEKLAQYMKLLTQKIDLTSKGEKLNNIDFSKLTEEEAKELRLKMIAEMNVKE